MEVPLDWKVGDEFLCICGCGYRGVVSLVNIDSVCSYDGGMFWVSEIRKFTKLDYALK